jgi:RimJ/RimL family protein N-acetyltransferase
MLRKATLEDSKMLFDWRNDPETRANSINTDPVQWEGHLCWLNKSLANPDRYLFIFEEGDVPVGTCRVDRYAEGNDNDVVYELSWTISPGWRGKGIGKKMLGELIGQDFLRGKKLKSVTKNNNIASIKMAEKFNFKLLSSDGEFGYWYLNNAASL